MSCFSVPPPHKLKKKKFIIKLFMKYQNLPMPLDTLSPRNTTFLPHQCRRSILSHLMNFSSGIKFFLINDVRCLFFYFSNDLSSNCHTEYSLVTASLSRVNRHNFWHWRFKEASLNHQNSKAMMFYYLKIILFFFLYFFFRH